MTLNPLPLIAFVHVPKTAGTTVNSVLRRSSHRGQSDCHFHIGDGCDVERSLSLARRSDWLSGHIARHKFTKALIWSGRRVEYFSVVREPTDHLLSLLNHSLQRYKLHHERSLPHEKALDVEVAATNLSDPYALKLLLVRNPALLDMQSSYLLGEDYAQLSDEELSCRLATYTCVVTTETVTNLYGAFGFAQLPRETRDVWENKSVRQVDEDIFRSAELQEFLTKHHRHDRRLYEAVSNAVWEAETRLPCRPSFLEATMVTAENFDEEAYLASNPDVADGVAKGALASGRAHFDSFGCNEERFLRGRVDP